jgi:hypothetical protein
MATTYELIASTTVGSGGVSTVSFTSIPATYTDLKVVFSNRNVNNEFNGMWFNGVKTNLTNKQVYGDGSSVGNWNRTDEYIGSTDRDSYTANTFGNSEIYIPNYTSSNYKSWSGELVGENNASAGWNTLVAGLWSNTSAITQITFDNLGGTVGQHSTYYLYGIKNS